MITANEQVEHLLDAPPVLLRLFMNSLIPFPFLKLPLPFLALKEFLDLRRPSFLAAKTFRFRPEGAVPTFHDWNVCSDTGNRFVS